MTLRERLFGPSNTDRLLTILQEDRHSQTALLTAFLSATTMQAELAKKQYDLWTAPQPKPTVRIMSSEQEAEYEELRRAALKPALASTVTTPDAFLASVQESFDAEKAFYE